ncbi:hypothetical protein H6G17_12145 [Chroococcidiopsis sp. FACHB-1243]|uniref:KGK domain-containing protein n=1 Tax=Chroococcidiopsis sp. [FACHB-1243] TaxID=2692781 RepID=UPI00177A99D9|nr:KGK domain-containing protein [Chroococcidiopsis sp. [FACHB-1243]]MBD2306264.1 hypothetical protein [Chroococcidiopsis sp. [FACHB-1243]]
MNIKFLPLDESVVFSLSHTTFKISEITKAMMEIWRHKGVDLLNDFLKSTGRGFFASSNCGVWSEKGLECEVLKPGKTWQKGKVRIKIIIEFSSDELESEEISVNNIQLESPLDDIRRTMSQNS